MIILVVKSSCYGHCVSMEFCIVHVKLFVINIRNAYSVCVYVYTYWVRCAISYMYSVHCVTVIVIPHNLWSKFVSNVV